jgi:hypothetical protein
VTRSVGSSRLSRISRAVTDSMGAAVIGRAYSRRL